MKTQNILFAEDLPEPEFAGLSLVSLGSNDGVRLSAEAEGPRTMIAPIVRPVDLTKSHGVKVTLKKLQEMVAAYDPVNVEAATLNFDHVNGGPAHGEATKLWIEGDTVYGRFENLSPEAVDGVASGRWKRRSAEILYQHPVTGGWYLTGMALLGSARPAVLGLPPALLLSHRPHRIDLSKETPMELEAPLEAAPAAPLEDTVLPPTAEETPAAEAAPVAAPAGDDGDPGDAIGATDAIDLSAERATLAADRAELEAVRAELDQRAAALAADTAAARRERVAVEVDRDLALLTGLPPAALRAGLRGALIELRLAEPLAVQLSAEQGGGQKPVAEILLAALATLPPIGVLASAQLASAAEEPAAAAGDHRTETERQVHLRARVTDERYLELHQKYGWGEIN